MVLLIVILVGENLYIGSKILSFTHREIYKDDEQKLNFCLLRIENVTVPSWYSNILFLWKQKQLISLCLVGSTNSSR